MRNQLNGTNYIETFNTDVNLVQLKITLQDQLPASFWFLLVAVRGGTGSTDGPEHVRL